MGYDLKSFCPEAWSQLEINNQGNYKLCCLANYDKDSGYAIDKDGRFMNVLEDSFINAMNSETHKSHRLELSQNIKPQRCRNCYESEDAHPNENKIGTSKRQRVINQTATKIPEYVTVETAASLTNPDGSIKPLIVNLDLRFGNLCNYKCIMCSPEFSNQWYKDWIDIKGGNSFSSQNYKILQDRHGKFYSNAPIWWETETWWKQWVEIENQVRYIYFTGGEPMLVPAHEEILDRLIKTGNAGKIRLRYDTNLSVLNSKILEKLKHFKKVFVCVSIDDTEDRYELIRFPGEYKRFISNLKELNNSGIGIWHISSCLGMFSPYAMFRVDKVAQELNVKPEYRFLEMPFMWDMRNYPRSAKLEMIENYNQSAHISNGAKEAANILTKYLDYENQNRLQEFVTTMNILDKNRGTNWKLTLDDVHSLLIRHAPYLDFNKTTL